MRVSLLSGVVAVLIMVAGSGCGDDDGKVAAFVSKLRQCDLMTDGRVNPYDYEEPVTAEDNCYANCYLSASCGDLAAMVCQSGDPSPSTIACMNACEGDDFVCADGSDTISGSWVCDGYEDCADGSDEVGCGSTGFECADGSETIPEGWVCDYEEDCLDGSDEVGCPAPPSFRCADGTLIEAWQDCDGEADCPDSSDEAGCAEITCPQ